MYEDYVRENKISEKSEDQKDFELIKSVLNTKIQLDNANRNFEYAEAELIDYYTYEIKANQAKLDYLLKKVKNRGLILDMVNQIKMNIQEDEVV